ncbi:SpvB/TcaC N-terminal domain-containing protein [Psychrosphaera algicola]|uniref:SpvB/TcaC N-terminal domain-containing protein n=1 Tax=Psychrosphaera algicola TaxID=3023714 RepID=UPI00351D14ED
MQPQVSLNYSSSNKSDGPMGIGWSIGATSAISRCPQNKFLMAKTMFADFSTIVETDYA